ncbi:MAG TPA: hypothetical protein VHU89_00310 [Acidobacteriaceae bacterium]|nr:hypothetical protein [Acidobacteriaceae bacterium]
MKSYRQYKNLILLLSISVAALTVEGYHPGVEDDAVYLSAIERRLHPGLYPHDFRFFTLQMQASLFDRMMAAWVRLTHIPVPVSELLGQFLAAFFLLWGCLAIARRCFPDEAGPWAGVGLVGVLFTLPVAGTALYIFDQYLHPRALAAALILWAVVAILDRRRLRAGVLLLLAVVMHPLMGVLGVSYCAILWIASLRVERRVEKPTMAAALFGFAPSWIFEGPTPAWKAALNTRTYYFLGRWTWYEWLGVVAPIFILWVMARWARRADRPVMAVLAGAGAVYAVFQLGVACVVLLTPGLVRLTPMQPMRYLHMVYLLMALLGGGLIGEKLLRGHVWRWLALFLPLAAGMFWAQRALFPGTVHLELPGRAPQNPWVQAFAWVRGNTPIDAYFALDPWYMALPGEDYHSFRALAERSELADAVKDAAVATQVPDLAPAWLAQTRAAAGWAHFQKQDFLRLQREFGVDWIVVRGAGVAGLACPYTNGAVSVCRL